MMLNYVGTWSEASTGQTFVRENPADSRISVGEFQESTSDDLEAAVETARAAQPAWADSSPLRRGEVLARTATLLRERSASIAADLTLEVGRPLAEAVGEVRRSADVFDYIAGASRREQGALFASATPGVSMLTSSRPLGVVAAITPFNFPALVATFKLAPALMAGNALVWKPSPLTPLTGVRIVETLIDAGVPPGVVNYLTGTSRELGEMLVAHPGVSAVSFTGSTSVGHAVEVAAAKAGKRFQAEKGGHNRLVVLADADLEAAAEGIVDGAFGATGQKCTSTALVLVEAPVADDLTALVLERATALCVGSPESPDTQVGPLVSKQAVDSVSMAVEQARRDGAEVQAGGRTPDGEAFRHGYYYEPTILTGVTPHMRIAREEVFGPTVGVLAVDSAEEALLLANDSDLGLSASIYTQSLGCVASFTSRMRAGVINVNLPTTGIEPHAPFGGVKNSGSGPKELGKGALDFYSEQSTVVVNASGN